jgi:hypothetical protein
MPAALSVPIRKEIVERRHRGESFRQIARDMGMSYASVRAIWRHWQTHGKLAPNYDACRAKGPRKPAGVVAQAIALKRDHPRWGAGLIRVLLSEDVEGGDLPSERTLQRWFRQAGVSRSPAAHQPSPREERGVAVHEVWAIDAKEMMTLADGSSASWLTISDEASGAILQAEAFPPQALEPDPTASGPAVSATSDGAVGAAQDDAL